MDEDDTEDDDGMDFDVGQRISSNTRKYIVIGKIGQGGFGAVYRVRTEPSDGNELAMKVERKDSRRAHSKLNMEVHLLKLLDALHDVSKNHFTKIVDRSKRKNYFMIVMTLVGKSLSDLKRGRNPSVFSLGTGLGISIQCLEAIEELHKIGFIHRDIKPGNFAAGLPPNSHRIYLLDFGMARKYTNDKGSVKGPRNEVKFKGTVRYAALNCHRRKELGPRDDCESWLYLVVDMCNKHGVPWKLDTEMPIVMRKKEESRNPLGRVRLFRPIGIVPMSLVMDYIDSLKYEDKIDYEYMYKMIRQTAAMAKVNIDDLYDWEKPSELGKNIVAWSSPSPYHDTIL